MSCDNMFWNMVHLEVFCKKKQLVDRYTRKYPVVWGKKTKANIQAVEFDWRKGITNTAGLMHNYPPSYLLFVTIYIIHGKAMFPRRIPYVTCTMHINGTHSDHIKRFVFGGISCLPSVLSMEITVVILYLLITPVTQISIVRGNYLDRWMLHLTQHDSVS